MITWLRTESSGMRGGVDAERGTACEMRSVVADECEGVGSADECEGVGSADECGRVRGRRECGRRRVDNSSTSKYLRVTNKDDLRL